jgi:hypothetical protein
MLVPLFPRRCDACTWGVITPGKCMVGPPVVHPTGVWPDVEPGDRCREYFPKHTPEGAPICRTCLYYAPDGAGFYCVFLPPGYSVSKMPRVHEIRRCHEWRPNYTLTVEE